MDKTEITRRLDALGYDVATPDGAVDAADWALRWFKRQNGLAEDAPFEEALRSDGAAPGVGARYPYYSMEDPLWGDWPYDAANTSDRETVSSSGCGPTSMAMAISHQIGRAVLPPVLCDWSNAHHHRDPDGQEGTYLSFFPACAALYGLTAEVHEEFGRDVFDQIAAALAAGCDVIACMAAGSPFTKCGHYAPIARIEDGRITMYDPVPKKNELPHYTVGEWLDGGWLASYIVVSKRTDTDRT
ncbi:MAG: hypothetical protein E7317_09200 [Clostridiales bacterium]|nr:hypothetical protein [Clostridiales bacterium]